MALPRFLWVPFELGRPFGTPNEPGFQRRVLASALALLEREDGPVVLEDFPEDAPTGDQDQDGPAWSCPVAFAPNHEDVPALAKATLEEMGTLAPWHEVYVAERGRSAPRNGPLDSETFLRALAQVAEGRLDPDVPTDLPFFEWVRLGCEDLRAWYLEAGQGRPGRAEARALSDWFWKQTAFARLIAHAATVVAASEDPGMKIFGTRSMVHRGYMDLLMPGIAPSTGELPTREENA